MPNPTLRDVPAAPGLWPHVLHIGLTAVLYNLAGAALGFLALFQLLSHLFRREPSAYLARLGGRLASWTQDAVRFLSYASVEPPAPLRRRAGAPRRRSGRPFADSGPL